MKHYEEIIKRVECVVEERIWATMTPVFSDSGIDITLYCTEYNFTFTRHIYYRELELDEPVLYTANKIVGEFEQELVKNIERL